MDTPLHTISEKYNLGLVGGYLFQGLVKVIKNHSFIEGKQEKLWEQKLRNQVMTILCRKMIEWLSKPSMYPWFLVTDRQNECIYKDASSFNTKYKLLSMLVNIRNLFPIFFEVKSVNHTLLHGIEGLFNPSPPPHPHLLAILLKVLHQLRPTIECQWFPSI